MIEENEQDYAFILLNMSFVIVSLLEMFVLQVSAELR